MKHATFARAIGASIALCVTISAQSLQQQDHAGELPRDYFFQENEDGSILAADASGTYFFPSFREYIGSPFFHANGMRCGSDRLPQFIGLGPADCNSTHTTISSTYDPTGGSTLYDIPVVVHVITTSSGTGNVSDALIQSQVQVLNEDFQALPGSLGAPGTNARIMFHLATTDPNGNPTTGITRHANTTWYNDGGSYWTAIAWDTRRFLNIYTNTAGGNLGYAYVPSGGGVVGNSFDRVVIYWPTMGKPAPYGPPYDLGRTVTHEVGHYLGLYHTFQGGCAAVSNCFNNGDLICDTLPESSPNFSPCTRSTCSDPDPTDNYMDYSDDICMDNFSAQQANRLRCTLMNFRVELGGAPPPPTLPGKATNPSPANGANNVSRNADLAWTAGSGATTHDVYFGTTNPPPLVSSNQAATTYVLPTLGSRVRYYWRIDERNAQGTTTGDVWNFRTRR